MTDRIKDGDNVELVEPATTLIERGRAQRKLPAGTRGMVERQAHGLLRLVIEDPNPADGLHDAMVVSSTRVRKVP